MAQVCCGYVITEPCLGLGQCLFGIHGNYELFFLALYLVSIYVIGRNTVSPPQLATDAPVVDVLQPVAVCGDVFLWMEFDFALEYGRQGYRGKVLHAQIPLHAQAWLDGNVGIAFAVSDLVLIVLDMIHQACFLQVKSYLPAYIIAVHADVHTGSLAYCTIGVKDIYCLQVVDLAQIVVVDIMCRSDLQTAGSELNIHVSVLDYRYNTAYQRYRDLVALEPLVLGIFGIDAHRGIAHNGLGTCRSNYCKVAFFVPVQDLAFLTCRYNRVGVCICHIVFQVIQLALLLAVYHLDVGEGCLCLGVPVDHAQAAVYQSFVIQVAEYPQHAFASCLVHREAGSVPVAAGTQPSQLLQYDATVLVCPIPGVFQKFLTCQVLFPDALLCQAIYNLCLGCY